jgi:hypothetical protein
MRRILDAERRDALALTTTIRRCQLGGRAVDHQAPAHQVAIGRIIEARRMAAVPMRAAIDAHVEADQNDPPGAELRRQVDRLKAGIAAVADVPA